MKITVETTVAAPIEKVWNAWNTPADIKQWNAASDDWHTTKASVDLRVGGAFSSRMEAKDGSMGFDFAGTYTKVVEHKLIESTFGDRTLLVEFMAAPDGVTVRETFDAESTHSVEQQRGGWQAILNNFRKHVEAKASKKKFLALFLVPPLVVEDWMKTDPDKRQAAQETMQAEWKRWMGDHAAMILSTEAGGKTKRVSSNGTSDFKNEIMLYAFVEAETHEAAAKAFENHPHLQIPRSAIEIMEVRPMGTM